MASGALVGGVGGRAAMLALRLTSDPQLRGRRTDDGFVIGELSLATTFLLSLTAVLGGVGGMAYLAVRTWLPARGRALLTGALTGLVGGAVVVEADGADFTALEPRWLAVTFFVALPALYGVALSTVVERLLAPSSSLQRVSQAPMATYSLGILALGGPPGLVLLAVLTGGWLLIRRFPALVSVWQSSWVSWLGRGLLGAGGAVAAVDLSTSVGRIL